MIAKLLQRAGTHLKLAVTAGALLALGSRLALGDSIVVPRQGVERNGPISFTYRLDRPATGRGVLDVEWSDIYKRQVEHQNIQVQLARGSELTFSLDMRRAVAMANHLRAHLLLDQSGTGDGQNRREASAEADFIARPPDPRWSDYQIIMWHDRDARQNAALKTMGVTAGKAYTNRSDDGGSMLDSDDMMPLLQNDMRWYIENIAVDLYSTYHRWFPDHPKTWLFDAAKQRYRDDPNDPAALVRDPSLSDPNWMKKIHDRLIRAVQAYAPYRPLYYNLGDETGVADLAAFWDFDFSNDSLQQMRIWLQQQYSTLDALNREWGSDFTSWDRVVPATTAAIMRQSGENFAAWADFKAWMNVAFARALRAGTDAVHSADPDAYAAIEGAQVPGWGGYDYSLLAHAVDVMEPYDSGNNIEIIRSMNPGMVILTTTGDGPESAHEDWRMLLNGSRGLILWDPDSAFVDTQGLAGGWGREAVGRFSEFRGGLGSLLIHSIWHTDPIAILYSPASMRTQWMLDQRPHGDQWVDRDAEREYEPNALRSAVGAYSGAIVHLGLQHRFLSSQQVEQGELRTDRFKVLILPHATSLSAREAEEIRAFAGQGGLIIADVEPGIFDQHSRRLPQPLLSDMFRNVSEPAAAPTSGAGKAIYLAPGVAPSGAVDPAFVRQMREVLQEAGVRPAFTLDGPEGEPAADVQVHSFQNGNATIIGLQRDLLPTPGETPAGDRPASKGDRSLVLKLAKPAFVYDIRRKLALGRIDSVPILLGDIEPVILAMSDNSMPPPGIAAPDRLHSGEIAELQIRCPGASLDSYRTVHLEVSDPTGSAVPYYAANVVAAAGVAHVTLPLALDALDGAWTIRITDVLTGQSSATVLKVSRP